jgi:ADP-ribose pyrophosphatase YjhB (NUDIX family)
MRDIMLCTGLLVRDGRVLLVCCRYEGEPSPLWVLPGGRAESRETVADAVAREFAEETGLEANVANLAYVSESIDTRRGDHVLNCTFWMTEKNDGIMPKARDRNVVETRFVPLDEAPQLLEADVLRIPVGTALRGDSGRHYYYFDASTVSVPFFARTGARGA